MLSVYFLRRVNRRHRLRNRVGCFFCWADLRAECHFLCFFTLNSNLVPAESFGARLPAVAFEHARQAPFKP